MSFFWDTMYEEGPSAWYSSQSGKSMENSLDRAERHDF